MNIQSTLVCTLIALLAAPAMAAHRQEPPEVWQGFAQKLEAGAFVEVRLKDGTKVKGNFIPSSGDTFRLKPKTRVPVPIRDFPYVDIESIDRKGEGWSPGMKVLVGGAIGVGVAVIGIFIYAVTGGD